MEGFSIRSPQMGMLNANNRFWLVRIPNLIWNQWVEFPGSRELFSQMLKSMDDRRKREKKLKKKRDRLQDRQEHERKLYRRQSFPVVSIGSRFEGMEGLLKEIGDAIISLTDSDTLPRKLRSDLEQMKSAKIQIDSKRHSVMTKELGQILYDHMQLSHQDLDRITYRFEVLIGEPNYWTITILVHALTKLGTRLFCSPKKYQLNIDGNPRIVAYKYHTLEQIGNRLVHDPNDYDTRAMSFAIPFYTKYFELAELSNGQPCIKLWNTCDPLTILGPVHGELLGDYACITIISGIPHFTIDDSICYYLLGYCPISLDESQGNFVVLDSLWIPGMDKTPEWAAYKRKHRLDTIGLANLSKRVNAHTYTGLVRDRDFQLIREFHEFVPQVRVIQEPVFDYSHLLENRGPSVPWRQVANPNNAFLADIHHECRPKNQAR